MAEIHGLLADLNAGKGTAGKLLKDDQLHRRLDELVAKLNGTHGQDRRRARARWASSW